MSEENKAISLDLSSSVLLQPSAANKEGAAAVRATRYDPVAQLMESDDSDSEVENNDTKTNIHKDTSGVEEPVNNTTETHAPDSADEEPKADKRTRRPLKASQFALNKDSVVGRMMGRHRRTVSEDSSDSDTPQSAANSPKDSLSPASSPPSSPNPKQRSKTSRAASKAAMLRMHQESERLFRETAVKIDPLDFTQRLQLTGFFELYDGRQNPEPTASPVKAKKFVVPPLQLKGSFAFMSKEDKQKFMILDDSDNYEGLFRRQKLEAKEFLKDSAAQRKESRLNAMLSHGSQPMHVSADTKVVPGSLALRDLNTALLDVIHKKDAEERAARMERAARKKQKEEMSQLVQQEEASQPAAQEEEVVVEEQLEDNGDELVDADSLLEPSSNLEAELYKRGKGRAVVTSDEESETEQPAASSKPKPTKAEFARKFNMLVREKPIHRPKVVRADPTPSMSQADSQLAESQEIPDPLLSQMYDINTQDSLLMTPEAPKEQQVGSDVELDALPTQMFESGLTQPTQMFEEEAKETQPTQPLDTSSMEETQPFETQPLEESAMPAATAPMTLEPEDPAESIEASQMEEQQASSPSRPHRRGRLLQRKSLADRPSQDARTKRPKQSAFVEAEAEEGDSSDSGNEAGTIRQRKFNWGNGSPDSSDEEDWDMDSDEEQAALMADPMIDHDDYEDSEADQQIRQLHLKQNVDADERDIQELFHDVTTGKLRNRTRMGFALSNDEDYNDRQTRAERMEERARLRRKLQMREIHDSNLAEIARNPETAAFAQAALMRAQDTDTEDAEETGRVEQLEEEVDEHSIATTVQKHLVRGVRRADSDVESEGSAGGSRRPASRLDSSQSSSTGDLADLDGDAFGSVAIEKLIVRRKTLLSTDKRSSANASWKPPPQKALLKRTGVAMAAANAKRLNSG
ncbi:hypothetical protein EV183_003616 [Coemansia sp. RSA 2336]|nr:hypothetical protein EV183_003616 [Coemansia sp. RSA 2336]